MSWHRLKSFFRGSGILPPSTTPPDSADILRQLLRSLQTKWEEHRSEGETALTEFRFSFQSGNFLVTCLQGNDFIRIHFPFFSDTSFSALDNVRHACNEFNLLQHDFKAAYTLNQQQHRLHLHLIVGFRLTEGDARQKDDFAHILSESFERARLFRQMLNDIMNTEQADLEENNELNARERYLAGQVERRHNEEKLFNHHKKTEPRSVGELFATLLEKTSDPHFVRLEMFTTSTEEDSYNKDDRLLSLTRHGDIADFDLLTPWISATTDTGTHNNPESSTMLVKAEVHEQGTQDFTIHIRKENESAEAIFFRITFTRPALALAPDHSAFSTERESTEQSTSFVVAIDHNDEQQRDAEFRYRYQEAEDALQQEENLSEEQQFMLLCERSDVGYNLYWGRRFFVSQRYYEALRHLENAYRVLNAGFHLLNKKKRDLFFELAYYIGSCYFELRLFRTAYFYLDMVYPVNSIRYTTAYVNTLVDSRDFRALGILNRLLTNLDRELENEEIADKDRAYFQQFLHFLKRRKGVVLIDMKNYDEAEEIFRSLIDFPDSEATAIHELLRIQQLRNEQNSSLS